MPIERIHLHNFKVFQDVLIKEIPEFAVFTGANGTGKSTLFDVFGFLKDCLTYNVSKALQFRGGFKEVVSRGHEQENIEIEIQYKLPVATVDRLVTYRVEIGIRDEKPSVVREILRYKRSSYGAPCHFLDFSNGTGLAVVNEEGFDRNGEQLQRERLDLGAQDILALKGVGQFQKFKAANALRQAIEQWHVSDFHSDAARGARDVATGDTEHLSVHEENLQCVAKKYLETQSNVFNAILDVMKRRVPGVHDITVQTTVDGRLVLILSWTKTFLTEH